jgi:hypothetical protein
MSSQKYPYLLQPVLFATHGPTQESEKHKTQKLVIKNLPDQFNQEDLVQHITAVFTVANLQMKLSLKDFKFMDNPHKKKFCFVTVPEQVEGILLSEQNPQNPLIFAGNTLKVSRAHY